MPTDRRATCASPIAWAGQTTDAELSLASSRRAWDIVGGLSVLSSVVRTVVVASWLVSLVAVGGCVSARVVTGVGSVEDLQAEEHYKQVYSEQMSKLQVDLRLLAPAGSNPGVCNKGGTLQGCFDADNQVIEDLQAMQGALAAAVVPTRFAAADKLLRGAIAGDIQGLELRNQAIVNRDDAAWKEHAVVLDKALAAFQEAYRAFPEDSRPQPPP
jgi:hypothetical protein